MEFQPSQNEDITSRKDKRLEQHTTLRNMSQMSVLQRFQTIDFHYLHYHKHQRFFVLLGVLLHQMR